MQDSKQKSEPIELTYEKAIGFARTLLTSYRFTFLEPSDLVHDAFVDGGLTPKNIRRIFFSSNFDNLFGKYDKNGYVKSTHQRVKLCRHCGEPKPAAAFRHLNDPRGFKYPFFLCYVCEPAYFQKKTASWRTNNQEKWKAIHNKASKKYYEANKHTKNYKATNKRNDAKQHLKDTVALPDSYIKKLLRLRGYTPEQMTPAVIRAKRRNVKAYRKKKAQSGNNYFFREKRKLHDGYIRQLLKIRGFADKSITPSLIETHRNRIQQLRQDRLNKVQPFYQNKAKKKKS